MSDYDHVDRYNKGEIAVAIPVLTTEDMFFLLMTNPVTYAVMFFYHIVQARGFAIVGIIIILFLVFLSYGYYSFFLFKHSLMRVHERTQKFRAYINSKNDSGVTVKDIIAFYCHTCVEQSYREAEEQKTVSD